MGVQLHLRVLSLNACQVAEAVKASLPSNSALVVKKLIGLSSDEVAAHSAPGSLQGERVRDAHKRRIQIKKNRNNKKNKIKKNKKQE